MSIEKKAKIFVAGHQGLVGSAIVRHLSAQGYQHIITQNRTQLDLQEAAAVQQFFERERPDYVFIAAAKVGGIYANSTYPVDFLRNNLLIELNVIHSAYLTNVRQLLFLGSSCIYPKFAPQPMPESALLDGKLEPTNEPYAVAKIAGVKLCQAYHRQYGCNFISAMPTNLYGPNDNFDLQNSHVLPALIRKFHDARHNKQNSVSIWGSGTPKRELMHVDDLADACLFVMQHYDDDEIINIGSGHEVSIYELAQLVAGIVGYEGEIQLDKSRPDGMPRKLVDISRMNALGWQPKIPLREGIASTYQWFLEHRPDQE